MRITLQGVSDGMPHVKRLTRAEVEWIGFHKAFLDMYALINEGAELTRMGQRIGGEHFAEKRLVFQEGILHYFRITAQYFAVAKGIEEALIQENSVRLLKYA